MRGGDGGTGCYSFYYGNYQSSKGRLGIDKYIKSSYKYCFGHDSFSKICSKPNLEKPDGGSGGKGGDVYFKSCDKMGSLYDLRRAHFLGNNGGPGKVSFV